MINGVMEIKELGIHDNYGNWFVPLVLALRFITSYSRWSLTSACFRLKCK